ncbi:MAG: hypothetical protein ABI689_07860 [Thermoanaerobaculia bacterium]
MTTKRLQRIAFLALAAIALFSSAALAQEKAWSLDVSVDYFDHYMFRGVPLLGDNEVLNPHVTYSMGNFNAYYYGYFGDVPADFTYSGNTISYHEDDFGADYTFALGEKFGLTLGIVSYMYSSEVNADYGFEDTYELYAIAAWDVAFSPTISYYRDMDAIEGAYASFGISHSFPLGSKASLDFAASVGFDFGYNLPEAYAADLGLDKSNGDLNDVLIGLSVPVQVNDWFGFHIAAQESIALSVLDDIGVDDETIFSGGVSFTF